MKAHEFDRIVGKFNMKTRRTHHLLAWFEHDGRTIARTRRSHGNKEPVDRTIAKQLKLTLEQLKAAVDCSLGHEGYIAVLKDQGEI